VCSVKAAAMIDKRIKRMFAIEPDKRLLVIDKCVFSGYFDYVPLLVGNGFEVYRYENVEEFRVLYEERLKKSAEKIAVIVTYDIYVPYDIQRSFRKVALSFSDVFPKLNGNVLLRNARDLDLIAFAYDNCYADSSSVSETERFLRDTAFTRPTVESYCSAKVNEVLEECSAATTYTDWIAVAKRIALIRYYAAKYDFNIDLSLADMEFKRFIQNGYGNLSTLVNRDYPAIVTKTLDVVSGSQNKKVALIVMDGMSLFDFEVLSRHFSGIDYKYYCSYAVIPTTTSISRQSLLSGKYPRELERPFSLASEEKEFADGVKRLGYADGQIRYLRGFEPDIDRSTKFMAVVINDIDDIVHGQRQGRLGMFNDMDVLGKSGKLQRLIERLAGQGFGVYITADHGNTPCVGVGGFRSGVEVESKSMRMAVLKDFAEANNLLTQNAYAYEGYYLDKVYRYYVCETGVSFDRKGESVMAHGGASLDEVIVPFIKITGVSGI